MGKTRFSGIKYAKFLLKYAKFGVCCFCVLWLVKVIGKDLGNAGNTHPSASVGLIDSPKPITKKDGLL